MNNQAEEIDIDGLSTEQISYSTMGRVPQPQDVEDFREHLSERQRAILKLRELGIRENWELAESLGLSKKTIDREIKKIKKVAQEMSLLG